MKNKRLKINNIIKKSLMKQLLLIMCTSFLLIFILVKSSYAILNNKTEAGLTDVIVQNGNLIANISSITEMI